MRIKLQKTGVEIQLAIFGDSSQLQISISTQFVRLQVGLQKDSGKPSDCWTAHLESQMSAETWELMAVVLGAGEVKFRTDWTSCCRIWSWWASASYWLVGPDHEDGGAKSGLSSHYLFKLTEMFTVQDAPAGSVRNWTQTAGLITQCVTSVLSGIGSAEVKVKLWIHFQVKTKREIPQIIQQKWQFSKIRITGQRGILGQVKQQS